MLSTSRKKRSCRPAAFRGEHPKQTLSAGKTSSSPLPSAIGARRGSDTSDPFDDRRDPHPAADAHRDEAGALVAALELVEDRADQHGACRTERVAEGDRAA